MAVVGVAHDDVLNVREGPGIRYGITGTLEPTAADIPVTGEARLLATSIWYEISLTGENGWVSGAFIGMFGATDDATLEVYAMLGEPLGDDDLAALGATIASAFLSDEGISWIALVEPSEGGSPTAVSSITYDVIGLADDAVKGYRLVIHATQALDDGPYTLHSVERTSVCWRGVDADGLCV
ncbi:MAG: SH3 domain-containing protein [Actinomycetia bacterium]|nr:SH3 domain-containing protein [Actinomycetes bacterium]